MSEAIQVSLSGRVAEIALARPQTRNALSIEVMEALIAALDAIAADDAVRCVLLYGQGPAFCAGHDLKELTSHRADADGGRAFFERTFALCGDLMTRMAGLQQPVIAAVEGVATAAGCQLVASCDLAVAGAAARFATPGVSIGLFCSTPAVALTRTLAPKHAMEMLMTGDMVDANEAMRIGLVNRVAPAGEALTAARVLADRIAAQSPAALRVGKRAMHAQMGLPLERAYELASEAMVQNLLDADAIEGIDAILSKRPPRWPS